MSEFTPFTGTGVFSGSFGCDSTFAAALNTNDGDTGRLFIHNSGAGTSNAHGAVTNTIPDNVGSIRVTWNAKTLFGPTAGNTFRIGFSNSLSNIFWGATHQQSEGSTVYADYSEVIDCTGPGVPGAGSNLIQIECESNGFDSYYIWTYMKVETTTHVVTVSSDTHSAFDQEGAITVADAGSLTVTATPSAGYRILDVLVDGVSVGNATGKTSYVVALTNVTTDHTVSVTAYAYVNNSMTDRGEYVTFVYDFSRSVEFEGLAQVVGSQGEDFPWSAPLITNTGAMVRTWDGNLYGANDGNTGSTANGAIYQLETGLYDTPVKVYGLVSALSTITGSLVQSTGVITALLPTDFRRVAVGGKITGSGITGTATVTAKSSVGDTITVTGTLTGNTTNQPYTCWGREIEADAYCVADRMGEVGGVFSAQRFNVHYACPTGEVVIVAHSYDLARSTQMELAALDATGAADTTTHRAPPFQDIVELPSVSRTGGPVHEFRFTSRNGSVGTDVLSRAEFWGIEALLRGMEQYK